MLGDQRRAKAERLWATGERRKMKRARRIYGELMQSPSEFRHAFLDGVAKMVYDPYPRLSQALLGTAAALGKAAADRVVYELSTRTRLSRPQAELLAPVLVRNKISVAQLPYNGDGAAMDALVRAIETIDTNFVEIDRRSRAAVYDAAVLHILSGPVTADELNAV